MIKARNANPRQGSSLKSFLRKEGIYRQVVAQAEKEILVAKLQSAMREKKMTITTLAKKMETSRTAVTRILDPKNASITLNTMRNAAAVLGKRWRFELVDT